MSFQENEEDIPGPPSVTTREEFMAAIEDRLRDGRRNIPIQVNMDDPDDEINLSGIDVSGLTFEGIFSGVDFEKSKITSCNLSGVKFIGCAFDKATFNGNTSLRGCDFEDSSLFKVVLGDNVDISGADFRKADDIDKIRDKNNNVISITKLKERGAILGEWWLTEGLERQRQRRIMRNVRTLTEFNDALAQNNFMFNLNIKNENMDNKTYQQITIKGKLQNTTLKKTKFINVLFEDVIFDSCNLENSNFNNCTFENVNIIGNSTLKNAFFGNVSFVKFVLSDNTILENTDFRYANYVDEILNEEGNKIPVEELVRRGVILDDILLQGVQRQSSNESDVGVGPFGFESEEEDNGFDNVFLPENLLNEQQFESLKKLVLDNLENVQDIINENDLMDLIYGIEDSIYEEKVIKDVLLEPLDMIQDEFLESEYKPNQTIKRAIDTLVLNLILESPILSDEGITQSDIIENIYPLAVREIEQNLTSETLKTLQNPFLPQNLVTKEEYDNYFDKLYEEKFKTQERFARKRRP